MQTYGPDRKGKIRQRTRVDATPTSPATPGRTVTIVTEADLLRQYGTYATLYQPFQQVYTVYPASADELSRKYGWSIYDTMMADSQVAACIHDLVDGALNDRPRAVPVDASPQAVAMAKWVDHNIAAMQQKTGYSAMALFRALLRNALVYGHSVAELVFDEVFGEPGDRPAYVLRKIVPLLPERYAFRMSSEGDVLGIVPFRFDATGAFAPIVAADAILDTRVVPSAKLLHIIWDRHGQHPTGRSALNAAFRAWALKQEMLDHAGILAKRIRKSWLGVLPPDARRVCVTDPETGAQETVDPRQDLLDVLQALANGEGGVVPTGTDVRSYEIEVHGAGQYFLAALQYLDRSILRAIQRRMLSSAHDASASTTGDYDRAAASKLVRYVRRWYEDSLYSLSHSICYFSFGADADRYAPAISVGSGDGLPISVQDIGLLHQSGWFTRAQKSALDNQLGLPPDDGGDIIGANSDSGETGDERRNNSGDNASAQDRPRKVPGARQRAATG